MKLSSVLLSLIAPVLCFAGANPQNAGNVQMFMRSSSAFNVYTDSPPTTTKNWLNAHFWRFQSSSPYFDSRLSWLPNSWAYVDLYGVSISSSLVTQHPDWILHDGRGNRLYIPWGCPGPECQNYAGDISNAGFRSWWIANAQSILAKGYKGFWIDDVNMEFRVGDWNGNQVAPYDSHTGTTMTYDDWRRYIAEFTEQIRNALPTAEIVHNAIWFSTPTRYNDQYVIREIKAADYLNCERGVSDSGLGSGTGEWSVRAFLNYVDAVHSYGSNVIFDEYSRNGDYGLAGYFLISNGGDAIGNQQATPSNWWSGYDVNLGPALGPRYDWKGLLRRDFLAGMVLLNPPKTDAITITLPSPLTKIGGSTSVSSLTLQPGQGAVLTGAVPVPDYTLTAGSASKTVGAGAIATYPVTVASVSGFSSPVALTVSGLPSGATSSFTPASLVGSGSSTLSIDTAISTPGGTYAVTIAATSGGLRHTTTVTLIVGGVRVNLSTSYNRYGLSSDGTAFTTGGLDGNGFTYSSNLFGKTQTIQGVAYDGGPANAANVVSSTTIPLPAGNFAVVNLLGTGVNGNQASQKFTVNYQDGTYSDYFQGLSDWFSPSGFAGETNGAVLPYRNVYSGARDGRTFHVYSYNFAVNKWKTLKSITLPNNRNVVVLAVSVTP